MATLAVQFGDRASGSQAVRSYNPSLLSFSAAFADALADAPELAGDMPIPEGMLLRHATATRQPQLELSGDFALRHRRAWGYMGELKIIDSNFTAAGSLLQVILLFPWRYGGGG